MKKLVSRILLLCFLPALAAGWWFSCDDRNAVDPGAEPLAQTAADDLPILVYHKVSDAPAPCGSTWVTRQVFARQMAALHAYGYTAVPLRDVVQHKKTGAPLPPRPVILTFDDGYACVYSIARPILNANGFRATCFLSTGFIGTEKRHDNSWDGGDRGCPATMLLWPEVAAMQAEGHSFEAHTLTHPRLSALHPVRAYREISGSKAEIESRLAAAVTCFAYPFGGGANNPFLRRLVGLAGYQAAVSYKTGMASLATSDIMALPRIKITQEHSPDLDPARPENFFMRLVDPRFPLPRITLDHIELADASGARGRTEFSPGEKLSVTVYARNRGAPVNVAASLQIRDNSGAFSAPVYDSHPNADVRKKPFACGGAVAFSYAWKIPAECPAGTYRLQVSMYDDKYVLGYFASQENNGPLVTIAASRP